LGFHRCHSFWNSTHFVLQRDCCEGNPYLVVHFTAMMTLHLEIGINPIILSPGVHNFEGVRAENPVVEKVQRPKLYLRTPTREKNEICAGNLNNESSQSFNQSTNRSVNHSISPFSCRVRELLPLRIGNDTSFPLYIFRFAQSNGNAHFDFCNRSVRGVSITLSVKMFLRTIQSGNTLTERLIDWWRMDQEGLLK
jgi:hypothetical protein